MYTDAQKRSHIFDLQTFLRRIQQAEGSATPLVPDGILGSQTAAAVREYQQQNCLPVTGIASTSAHGTPSTLHMPRLSPPMHFPCRRHSSRPESDAVLKPGAKSPTVYVIQLMLGEIAPHYNRIAASAAHGRVRCGYTVRCQTCTENFSAARDRHYRSSHMAGTDRAAQCFVPADTARLANQWRIAIGK